MWASTWNARRFAAGDRTTCVDADHGAPVSAVVAFERQLRARTPARAPLSQRKRPGVALTLNGVSALDQRRLGGHGRDPLGSAKKEAISGEYIDRK